MLSCAANAVFSNRLFFCFYSATTLTKAIQQNSVQLDK